VEIRRNYFFITLAISNSIKATRLMNRIIVTTFFILLSCLVYSQGFPDAQKQPRFKEMRSRHKHYAKQARRRHIKRGTAFIQYNCPFNAALPVCFLAATEEFPFMKAKITRLLS
jgi:hypothetical protein